MARKPKTYYGVDPIVIDLINRIKELELSIADMHKDPPVKATPSSSSIARTIVGSRDYVMLFLKEYRSIYKEDLPLEFRSIGGAAQQVTLFLKNRVVSKELYVEYILNLFTDAWTWPGGGRPSLSSIINPRMFGRFIFLRKQNKASGSQSFTIEQSDPASMVGSDLKLRHKPI